MKLLVCLAIVAIVAGTRDLTDEEKQNWKKWSDECKSETGVSQDSIDKLRRGEHVDDPLIKKQACCFAKKSGLCNGSGNLDTAQLRSKLKRVRDNDVEVEALIKKCAVKKDSLEQTYLDTYACLYKNEPNFAAV